MKINRLFTLIILATMGCANNGWSQELTGAGSTSPTTSLSLPATVGSLNTKIGEKSSISDVQSRVLDKVKNSWNENSVKVDNVVFNANAHVNSDKNPNSSNNNGECVSYVKNARPDLPWKGDAAEAASNLKKAGYEVNNIPRVGSAFTIPAFGFGHTGVVTGVELVEKDGKFFYKVDFNDANRGGTGLNQEYTRIKTGVGDVGDQNGVVRPGTVLLSYPDAIGKFTFVNRGTDTPNENTTHEYQFTFIHEEKSVYDKKQKVLENIIEQLYNADLFKKNDPVTIREKDYVNTDKKENLIALMMVIAGNQEKFNRFIDLVKAYKVDFGGAVDLAGLLAGGKLIASGKSVSDVFDIWKLPVSEKKVEINPWATVTMQNQLTAITNGSTSHIGSASLYAGINNQVNANVNPNNTNNSQLQTGAQQSGYASNTQAFQSSNWVMVTGDPATHLAAGNSFGSITAPNGGQIASLNNANLPYTLVTKDFYVPVGVKQVTLTFNGNFVTNEYPVYVGSMYNDNATVKITSPSGNVTPVTAFNQTLNSGNFTTVNGLPTPLMATGGQTGFKASSATIAVAGGGVVTVQVKVANVGDTAFPSAVLLNNITVK